MFIDKYTEKRENNCPILKYPCRLKAHLSLCYVIVSTLCRLSLKPIYLFIYLFIHIIYYE